MESASDTVAGGNDSQVELARPPPTIVFESQPLIPGPPWAADAVPAEWTPGSWRVLALLAAATFALATIVDWRLLGMVPLLALPFLAHVGLGMRVLHKWTPERNVALRAAVEGMLVVTPLVVLVEWFIGIVVSIVILLALGRDDDGHFAKTLDEARARSVWAFLALTVWRPACTAGLVEEYAKLRVARRVRGRYTSGDDDLNATIGYTLWTVAGFALVEDVGYVAIAPAAIRWPVVAVRACTWFVHLVPACFIARRVAAAAGTTLPGMQPGFASLAWPILWHASVDLFLLHMQLFFDGDLQAYEAGAAIAGLAFWLFVLAGAAMCCGCRWCRACPCCSRSGPSTDEGIGDTV